MSLQVLLVWILSMVNQATSEIPSILPQDSEVNLDFLTAELPKGVVIAVKSWKIADGVLRGTGGGYVEIPVPENGNWKLSFQGSSDEKANFEVKAFDKTGKTEIYTFAFLGRYHSVLDGPKSCILKGPAFVNVSSKMWIFPGRMFNFDVKCAKSQFQMFLNGELGPNFVDDKPAEPEGGLKLRIYVSPESEKDGWKIDNIKLKSKRP